MCDFHSILGASLGGGKYEIFHDPGNSHSDMAKKFLGGLVNKPNREPVIFEAEWNGEGDVPVNGKLIRNSGECPEPLVNKIRAHYAKLKEALESGKHLDSYFKDGEKWRDVWEQCIRRGVVKELPFTTWSGYVEVHEGATFTAPVLAEVSGYVEVHEGATFTAPVLAKSGYVDVREGATFTAPVLAEVSGSVYVREGATFTAPVLAEVSGSVDVREGGKLIAPKLKR